MDPKKILVEQISKAPSVTAVLSQLRKGRLVTAKGLTGALKSIFLTLVTESKGGIVLYVSPEKEEAEEIKEEAEQLMDASRLHFFPGGILSPTGLGRLNHQDARARLSTLESMTNSAGGLIIANPSALLKTLPHPSEFLSQKISVTVGENFDFDRLVNELLYLGFSREDRVEHPGEICVRGGIVDVFPLSAPHPFRLEFWDNEVESIRTFVPETQRSLNSVDDIEIFLQDIVFKEDESIEKHSSLLDYLNEEAIVVLDEPDRVGRCLSEMLGEGPNSRGTTPESGFTWARFLERLSNYKRLDFISVGQDYDNLVDFSSGSPRRFKGNMKQFKSFVDGKSVDPYEIGASHPLIVYCCDSDSQVSRISDIFQEENISAANLQVGTLALHNGFNFPEANLTVFTDHEFFGRAKRLRLHKQNFKGLTPGQLKRLDIGDYVVHVDFGIAVYRGLKKIEVRGHERECLKLQYRDKDVVYVPVERLDRVNKYSPKDGAEPRLNKLGSPEWSRLKAKTKKKIKNIAKDLIEIYAKRKSQPGFAFSEDGLWQRELEASFPYEDTEDQATATIEVKRDMESPRPMDRLVCGDVGFGKTEIAVRASFKSVLSGKQVGILVPTTILAYQHLNTFRERFKNFPVNIEMLSRFRTRLQQQEIIKQVRAGAIDILIGTHRILSKDVTFADLGLLVVDEEHRFGVTHKEKLKTLRATIDVLTLTATPIPRTLQFSLLGARDLTHINTPPKNRLPILTEILTYNKTYIKGVILRELDRDGQVFFVHNRVRSIEQVARMVRELVPEAKVVVAHGQLPEKKLEKIMVDFMAHKYQILVSTMIIESGLDMPNVNTIVVNRADKLGLAQLYQLRGRVGRSSQRAYAYFIIPPIETLTDDALKRLRAIEEFSDIGSGGQLALRDLEIRGAGNLLGAEQTGFIDTLGFELYNKILEEGVRELKSDALATSEKTSEIEPKVEISCDAFLPETYVSASSDRVDVYRRMMDSMAVDELDEIALELQDRFGRLPQPVRNLLDYVAIRLISKQAGLASISIDKGQVLAHYSPEFLELQGEQIQKWLGSIVAQASQPFEFVQNEGIAIRLRVQAQENKSLSEVRTFLSSLPTQTRQTEGPAIR